MDRPIGILYEHPEWFRPLFSELDRRGLPFERIAAHEHRFDPDGSFAPYSLLVNRVSPSAFLRDHTSAVFFTQQYLAHLEGLGVPLINGTRAFSFETSKARQLGLLASLGLPHPRSRVVNHLGQIEAAAAEIEYPIMIKPNIGGSGALMRRFDRPAELRAALAAGELDGVLGLDQTAIVQEYHSPVGGSIVRVEALDAQYLYAIRIHNDPSQGFNICPADICQLPESQPAPEPVSAFELCPVDAPVKRSLKIEVATPPGWVVAGVLEIFRAADIDVGGVEYLESERDGKIYFYDVNALSNFVTDAPTMLGFDPFVSFVDMIERRAGLAQREVVAAFA